MGQSRAVGTLVYPVEAGNAGTRTVRESVPPVLPKPRLLDRVREARRVRHYRGDGYIEKTRLECAGNVVVRMLPERWLTVDYAKAGAP